MPALIKDRSGYLAEDTIAAIATALGGPISLIRISGPRAFDALELLSRIQESSRAPVAPRYLSRVQLKEPNGKPLDDALAVRFVRPESFTGEDVVELHLHGSPYIAPRILEILAQNGVRQALPGEFSFRAVRNGKLTLNQAQAVADLIAAANDSAVSLALEKMSGSQNRLLHQLAESLRTLAAHGELGIDFADQDVEEISLPRLKQRLEPITHTLIQLRDSYDRGSRIQEGIKVAFLGLPNAGKSSFFNAILGEDRSIVSEIPGTTRDVVTEKITLRGRDQMVTLRLEDTAGLRTSHDRIERMGIERSRKSASQSDLVLFLIDATTLIATGIAESLTQWDPIGRPGSKSIGILTKADLLSSTQRAELASRIPEFESSFGIAHWATVSSQTGEGITEAIEKITAYCSRWTSRSEGEILLTRVDQLDAISSALDSLKRAREASGLDLFAADIRQALHALARLIGETPPDDILGQIFSQFCIGK